MLLLLLLCEIRALIHTQRFVHSTLRPVSRLTKSGQVVHLNLGPLEKVFYTDRLGPYVLFARQVRMQFVNQALKDVPADLPQLG